MKKGQLIYLVTAILMLCFQESKASTPYEKTRINQEDGRQAMRSASKGVDYSDEASRRKKKEKKRENKEGEGSQRRSDGSSYFPRGGALPTVAKVIVIVLGSGLLFFIIYSLLKSVRSGKKLDISDEETEEFARLNLKTPLEEHLGKGEYRMACRILYLQLLQVLVKWRAILWRNEKTNWDYYYEAIKAVRLNKERLYEITQRYDHLWYGEKEPGKQQFAEFERLIKEIRK